MSGLAKEDFGRIEGGVFYDRGCEYASAPRHRLALCFSLPATNIIVDLVDSLEVLDAETARIWLGSSP